MEALRLEDKVKEEWVDGVYNMTPAASPRHNRVLNKLQFLIQSYLEDKDCELFRENIDLVLVDPEAITAAKLMEAEKETKVRPDLLVFCENQYVELGNNIIGIPDFIIEVLSPGSVKWDKVVKKEKYLEAGVKEYWIIDPLEEEVFKYFGGKETTYSFADSVKIEIFENLAIDFPKIQKLFFKLG